MTDLIAQQQIRKKKVARAAVAIAVAFSPKKRNNIGPTAINGVALTITASVSRPCFSFGLTALIHPKANDRNRPIKKPANALEDVNMSDSKIKELVEPAKK